MINYAKIQGSLYLSLPPPHYETDKTVILIWEFGFQSLSTNSFVTVINLRATKPRAHC